MDPRYREFLDLAYPEYEKIHHKEKRGFCGAVQSGWAVAAESRFTFWLEDDFLFMRPVPLTHMMNVLTENPHLAQLALLRQPWSPEEQKAGGIMQMWPDEYTEVTDGHSTWVEHTLFYTTNPSLFRGELARNNPWPDGPACEGKFSEQLRASDPEIRFAFWGQKFEPHRVLHIGEERVGLGY
jgi:hypothetical protein